MKKIKITTIVLNVELNRVDFEILVDDDIFEFLRDKPTRVCKTGTRAYVCFMDNGKLVRLSRYVHGIKNKGMYIRHKDKNIFNCMRENLDTVSRSSLNRLRETKNYRGVRKYYLMSGHTRYSALIWINGRYIQVAICDNERTAAMKYDAATKFLGIQTHVNVTSETLELTEDEKGKLLRKKDEDC